MPDSDPREHPFVQTLDDVIAAYTLMREEGVKTLPVDPAEHREAVIIATAIAAADKPESSFSVKRVSMVNPEYRRVACIASALGAGALPESSFVVKHVYRQKSLEETHAA